MNAILDNTSNTTYTIEELLGKGSFGRCYKIKDVASSNIFACKVIPTLTYKEFTYILKEIEIQKSLTHRFILSLHSSFKYKHYTCIILELCGKRSLRELLKRRKTLTVPEVRYFMHQILQACSYMHENNVVHRDLKLDNILLNDNLEIKVADFGFAVRISTTEEKRESVVGTPCYIAPEVLNHIGYGYEVDIWSVGCIMYALLVGSLPFEFELLKDVFKKIKKNDFFLPPGLDATARALLKKLLHPNPSRRPSARDALEHNFFISDFLPSHLPKSSFTMIPRF